MGEERKTKEIEYYDKEAKIVGESEIKEAGSLGGFNPLSLSSYKFLYSLVEKKCLQKKVLDYGCGMGLHIGAISKYAGEVVGIDLSRKSLEVSKKRLKKENIKNARVLLMDAEKMEFSDDSFDVVFDGATFSSLDFKKALSEIVRVLKPDGVLFGIETFGHNPLTNFKRKLNTIRGKRTGWAAEHIFNIKDVEMAKKYFKSIEVYFFHLISWAAFPLLSLPGGKFLLQLLEFIEKPFLNIGFLKKYSFKIVFVFSFPKK